MANEHQCPACGSHDVYYVEVLGVYDGALYLECHCKHRWHRFEEGHWLRKRAEPFVNPPSASA